VVSYISHNQFDGVPVLLPCGCLGVTTSSELGDEPISFDSLIPVFGYESHRIITRTITVRVVARIVTVKVLGVRFIVDIVDRHNVCVCFGRRERSNVLSVQEESKCIIEIRAGILVVFLTTKDVVE
jgi:hypothetical protein